MPVVQIEALPQPDVVNIPLALREVRDAVASGLGCEAGQVWVTWRTLDAYLCHDESPETQPRHSHDPILRIIAYKGRKPEQISGTLAGVSIVLAGALGLEPGNVFAIYEEAKPRRVHIGGTVRGEPAEPA